jgi:heterodisulfide reductase subunit A-like polyferredoxin
MNGKRVTGIYFSDNVNGHESEIDINEIMHYAMDIPCVSVTWNGDLELSAKTEQIVSEIKKYNLNRIVLAGEQPGLVKSLFAKAMYLADKDPENLILASFNEYCDGWENKTDLANCIGCGICSEKCPSTTLSEFDLGTILRKAIYIPFPQAVPNKYLIDADSCRYVQDGKCGVCVKVCPAQCIDLNEQDKETEIQVGNIIVATGFKVFDAKRIERFGYGKYPNVLTSIEFERLVNAAGPTGGDIKFRTQDKKGNWIFVPEGDEPQSIALIHCVGSRDQNYNRRMDNYC